MSDLFVSNNAAYWFMINTANDYSNDSAYIDDDGVMQYPPLTQAELNAVAELTNEEFGTDLSADEVYDYLEEFEKGELEGLNDDDIAELLKE